ncbi:MAG: hypothetical protein IKB72_04305 [Ruminococcus sp.]|nr:hypothetical protein [Ruminococcus sp.]
MPEIGWVKLHRKLKNWRWYKDQPTKALFIHFLLEAEWVGDNRGQIITTESDLEKETGLSRQQIRTAIKHLQATKEITKQVTNGLTNKVTDKKTVITIENYNLYQGEDIEPNQEANQQEEFNLTNDQPTSNQSTINIKNYEEVIKNIKNNSARAHVRHADGVSINEEGRDLALLMAPEHREKLYELREHLRKCDLEYAEAERGQNI